MLQGISEWCALKLIAARFPFAKQLSVADTDLMVQDRAQSGLQPPIFLDVRNEDEFRVSHIDGAQNIPYDSIKDDSSSAQKTILDLASQYEGRTVICYCSIGYRSSHCAELMTKAGHSDCWNLSGSIFSWANQGKPMIDLDGLQTDKAHPYSKTWGTLLNPSLHQWPDQK